MTIGAVDFIDQLLVDKYDQVQVDNHGDIKSAVEPEKMLGAMNEFANMSRNMLVLNQKLTSTCNALKAVNAQYRKAAIINMNNGALEYAQ